ncbi:hypothetical protein CMO96_02300 [Candidatus Woesebacteria bacterium]|nr:hypothetical protein [Candidatus Woesebacteria bacterium]
MSTRLTAYILLLLSSIIWGASGPIIKFTLDFTTPFNFLFWRFLLVAVVATPIFLWYIKRHPIKTQWLPKIIFLGFLATTINLSLVFFGFERTSAIQGTLLASIAPIFVVTGGIIFLKEKVTRREQIGISLAFLGTIFIVLEPLLQQGVFITNDMVLGNFLLILANLSWMVFVLLSKNWFEEGIKPFHIVFISFLVGLVSFFPLSIIESSSLPSIANVAPSGILGIAFMAIFAGLIAYTAYEVALARIEASEATVFHYLLPIWAAPLAVLWLGEIITPTFLIGALIIAIGVVIAEYRKGLLTGIRSHHLAHHK